MTILTKPLRRQLETTIKQAREIAEEAAKDAIARIGVAEAEAPAHLSNDTKALRRRLRAHARTLGDTRDAAGAMSTARLQDAASYEIWHRMLFGRFLAERGLLIHPELGAAISVAELRDLATEEGAADEWALAERYAAPGLPGVFKPDDPVLALPIAPEFSKRLRAALSGLPDDVFAADDSLGWTYQFWQAAEKDAVNKAGGKIGAKELPAVTQLFTEPYMVKFLLHNTLGAWWAGKLLAARPDLARDAEDEDALRQACALPDYRWDFLRFVREGEVWRPAAGTYSGWPQIAANITVLDPCCGSGHFLTEALAALTALRAQEEGLTPADATVAVLRHNLAGLEIDGRCVQIAAFALALVAWRIGGVGIAIPTPHVAWVGAPPPLAKSDFAALANGDAELRRGLEALHDLFVQAPLLGSLIQPVGGDLVDPMRVARIEASIDALVEKMRGAEAERAEGALAARGMADAATILSRRWTLQTTNVPFLGRGRQNPALADHLANRFAIAKADLATAMVERMRGLSAVGGAITAVIPQSALYLGGFEMFRKTLLSSAEISTVAALGGRAFETISGEIVSVALLIFQNAKPNPTTMYSAVDSNELRTPAEKHQSLIQDEIKIQLQNTQLENSEFRITIGHSASGSMLEHFAVTAHGMTTFDRPQFIHFCWEISELSDDWTYLQTSPTADSYYSGADSVVLWEGGRGRLFELMEEKRTTEGYTSGVWKAGSQFWGTPGILVNLMNDMPSAFYCGYAFDHNVGFLGPKSVTDLSAIWAFIDDGELLTAVRNIDRSLKVPNATLGKVPFKADHWRTIASARYSDSLPEPYSDDPSQWLFHGHPRFAEPGTELHVALARLAGYRWPAENDPDMRLSDLARERIAQAAALPAGNADGLLPLHARGAKPSLADGLRAMLAASFGAALSPAQEQALVRTSDAKLDKKEARDASLETWLRDRAFRQHCVLFHQRPFLWQVWDGLQGGFSAFLHYHRLDNAALNTLTYTLLGDWIRAAKAEGNTARQERAEQLQQKLAKIIEGEDPYDIFVRWKPLARQPLGWNPDVDDGVRLNIRPFMTAGILREQPKGISWNKDRGTDVPSAPWYDLGPSHGGNPGDRINDHHTTLAEKRAARGTS